MDYCMAMFLILSVEVIIFLYPSCIEGLVQDEHFSMHTLNGASKLALTTHIFGQMGKRLNESMKKADMNLWRFEKLVVLSGKLNELDTTVVFIF